MIHDSAEFFEPSAETRSTNFPSREEGLGVTACRQVCRAQGANAAAAEAAVGEAHRNRTGKWGMSLGALLDAGFPVALAAVVCKMSQPAAFLGAFAKTPLYAAWQKTGESDLDWVARASRGLVFHWTGWGVCVLHNDYMLDARGGRIIIITDPADPIDDETSSGELYVHTLANLAAAVGWPPFS